MNCLIVDDDKMSRSSLEFICSRIDGVNTTTVSSALEASRLLNSQTFDLIFLDIEMPEMNGLDLIRFSKRMPPIIITSANTKYAFDAFQLDAVDYLAKPLTLPRVMKAITKVSALSELSSNNTVQPVGDSSVFIRVDGKHIKLDFNDIFVVESMRDYVMFRTEKSRFIVHSTLKNIEERLGHDRRFLKIHRSFIINTDTITDFDERSVVCGPYNIPVSRSNRTVLQKHLNSF
jgi:DNA-binding LytR/AlgR family response regulator